MDSRKNTRLVLIYLFKTASFVVDLFLLHLSLLRRCYIAIKAPDPANLLLCDSDILGHPAKLQYALSP